MEKSDKVEFLKIFITALQLKFETINHQKNIILNFLENDKRLKAAIQSGTEKFIDEAVEKAYFEFRQQVEEHIKNLKFKDLSEKKSEDSLECKKPSKLQDLLLKTKTIAHEKIKNTLKHVILSKLSENIVTNMQLALTVKINLEFYKSKLLIIIEKVIKDNEILKENLNSVLSITLKYLIQSDKRFFRNIADFSYIKAENSSSIPIYFFETELTNDMNLLWSEEVYSHLADVFVSALNVGVETIEIEAVSILNDLNPFENALQLLIQESKYFLQQIVSTSHSI